MKEDNGIKEDIIRGQRVSLIVTVESLDAALDEFPSISALVFTLCYIFTALDFVFAFAIFLAAMWVYTLLLHLRR